MLICKDIFQKSRLACSSVLSGESNCAVHTPFIDVCTGVSFADFVLVR